MNSRKSLLLGAVLVLAASGAASAADLGSTKDYYVAAEAPGPSWYFRVDGGYATHDEPVMVEGGIFDLTDTGLGETWTFGGGIGRYFTRNIRGDVTVDYRFEADAEGTLADPNSTLPGVRHFGVKSTVVLANLYYDFNAGGRFSPYVGVGLGYAFHETTAGTVDGSCGCDGIIEGDSNGHVAGALMAGFAWNLFANRQEMAGSTKDGPVYAAPSRALYLDVGYRFLYLGETATGPVRGLVNGTPDVSEDPTVEEIHAHELRVGLRYDFR